MRPRRVPYLPAPPVASATAFDGMPRSALRRVAVDHVATLADLPPLLARLAREIDGRARQNEALGGRLSGLTCPECHGALWQMDEPEETIRYRCRVGHAYAEKSLHEAKRISIEAALWTALTALEEHAALTWRMARRAADGGHEERWRRYEERAHGYEERARVVAERLHGTSLVAAGGGALPPTDTGAP